MSTATLPRGIQHDSYGPYRVVRPLYPAWLRSVVRYLPLVVILAVQTVLTVRLFGGLTNDEGRYLAAGHALWYELFHGGGSPYYEMYFSGAPVIYSPIAAIAQDLGGFTQARLLSTFCMLVATTAMFGTTRRLFGYWAAVIACGFYIGLYIAQAVGRNIIYDAMALAVLSVASYCASRAGTGSSAGWLLAVVPVLVLADFTKYVMIIFDPAVIAICVYQIRDRGWKDMFRRIWVLSVATLGAYVLTIFIAGSSYWTGMLYTTFGRHTGSNALLAAVFEPPNVIIGETLSWFGLVIALAFAAIVFAAARTPGSERWPLVALLTTLAGASVLVALEGIHLHSDESMGRHSAFAAWFGCIAVGYLASALAKQSSSAVWKAPIMVIALAAVIASGYHYSFHNRAFSNLGGAGNKVAIPAVFYSLQPYMGNPDNRYLIDGDTGFMVMSWDGVYIPWWNLTDDNYIKYPIPGRGGTWHWTTRGPTCRRLLPGCQYLTGSLGYTEAIHAHAFALISLHRHTLPTDTAIERAAESTPGYVLVNDTDGGPTWIYAPDYEKFPTPYRR
jgi:4-amino-4-deoxy-L-arabinose transferase-like glycosyltransferase